MNKPWNKVERKTEEILKLYQDLKIDIKSKELTWKEKKYFPQTKTEEKHIFYEIDSDTYILIENKEMTCLAVLEKNEKLKFNLVLKPNSADNYQVKDVNLNLGDFWGLMMENQ